MSRRLAAHLFHCPVLLCKELGVNLIFLHDMAFEHLFEHHVAVHRVSGDGRHLGVLKLNESIAFRLGIAFAARYSPALHISKLGEESFQLLFIETMWEAAVGQRKHYKIRVKLINGV